MTDQHITLYDGPHGRRSAWSPVHGPMPLGATYGIGFNSKRVYRHHERVPPLLAHHLLPTEGLQWVASDQDALHNWLAAIQGDLSDADAIGEIVGKADGLSVARNLTGRKNVQLPTAKAKPLVERLLTGLRYLLDNGDLPMNRRGAAAYLDDDTLWLVSKTTLDKLRTHLIEEGQPGIPTRNDRLMDEMQQHGLLVPNDDRAVWLCSITINDWQQQLTCLRMEVSRLWSDPVRAPDAMDGHVEPVGAEPGDADTAVATLADTGDSGIEPRSAATPPADQPTPYPSVAMTRQDDTPVDGLPLPFDIPDQPPNEKPAADHKTDGQVAGMDASEDAGKRFLAWLKQSIENETVPINTAKACIHVLPEGLALVSPRIFRDFDSANWSHVQKRFQKLGLHRKTARDQNIWTCEVAGTRKQALLKIVLIPNAERTLKVDLTKTNSAVKLIADA